MERLWSPALLSNSLRRREGQLVLATGVPVFFTPFCSLLRSLFQCPYRQTRGRRGHSKRTGRASKKEEERRRKRETKEIKIYLRCRQVLKFYIPPINFLFNVCRKDHKIYCQYENGLQQGVGGHSNWSRLRLRSKMQSSGKIGVVKQSRL